MKITIFTYYYFYYHYYFYLYIYIHIFTVKMLVKSMMKSPRVGTTAHAPALDLSLVGSEAASSTCFVSQNEAALDIAGVAQYSDALGHVPRFSTVVPRI